MSRDNINYLVLSYIYHINLSLLIWAISKPKVSTRWSDNRKAAGVKARKGIKPQHRDKELLGVINNLREATAVHTFQPT